MIRIPCRDMVLRLACDNSVLVCTRPGLGVHDRHVCLAGMSHAHDRLGQPHVATEIFLSQQSWDMGGDYRVAIENFSVATELGHGRRLPCCD